MRKRVVFLLVAVMVLTMNCNVFAEETAASTDTGSEAGVSSSQEIQVYGTYSEMLYAEQIISVDVAWESMIFTYAAGQQGVWNPESHSYQGSKTDAEWIRNSADITITNHSNVGITANLTFAQTASATGSFGGKDTVELETAVGTLYSEAPSMVIPFTVNGTMSDGETTLGTITISLEAVAFSGLNLASAATDNWKTLIQEYLTQIDPDKNGEVALPMKLGRTTITNTEIGLVRDALSEYYPNDEQVALTIYDALEIGSLAFNGSAYHMSSINLPNVTKIGEKAFQFCGKVKSFYLPKVTHIGEMAFKYCGDCQSITFGTTLQYVGRSWLGEGTGSTDFAGTEANSTNITLTIGAEQGNYQYSESIIYKTETGLNGQFASYTFKEVKRAE